MWLNNSRNISRLQKILLITLFVLISNPIAQANEWIPVNGKETLSNYMSGMQAQRTLPSGNMSRGEWRQDSLATGLLLAC